LLSPSYSSRSDNTSNVFGKAKSLHNLHKISQKSQDQEFERVAPAEVKRCVPAERAQMDMATGIPDRRKRALRLQRKNERVAQLASIRGHDLSLTPWSSLVAHHAVYNLYNDYLEYKIVIAQIVPELFVYES
jgi:hypothetical protein